MLLLLNDGCQEKNNLWSLLKSGWCKYVVSRNGNAVCCFGELVVFVDNNAKK